MYMYIYVPIYYDVGANESNTSWEKINLFINDIKLVFFAD